MSKENMRVMDKLIRQCRQAYQAKKPLILIDTEDIDLMDRLARDSRLIDFYEEAEKAYLTGQSEERKYVKYRKYIGYLPDVLDRSPNFTYYPQDLKELAAGGGSLSYGKGPMMLVAHLTQQDRNTVECLRAYVHSYVRCPDNTSALRSSCVLLYGDLSVLPQDLLRYTEILTVDYPSQAEIKEILLKTVKESGYPLLEEDVANEISELLVGFSLTRAEEYINRLLWIDGEDGKPMRFSGKRKSILLDAKARAEIKEILLKAVKKSGHPLLEEDVANEVSEFLVGFSLTRAEEYINRLLRIDGEDGKPMLFSGKRKSILLDAKAQAIRSTGGLLTLYREKEEAEESAEKTAKTGKTPSDGENDLGGMGAYKVWAEEAGLHMKDNNGYALRRGVPAMKGVLLCGVPGCGKSEAAKILHRQWKIPMLRLDVDQLMGGLVGDSERNMRQALALAEAMSPCILWIDEIEKGFGGASSDQGDGGTFKRMFGRLLTWMQENKKPCFIFATANDISHLPPEFFRSGRFDALFSVYMPTNKECKEIFAEQMRRADKRRTDTAKAQGRTGEYAPLFDGKCFEDTSLQSIMDIVMQGKDPKTGADVKFLSGADIEKIVFLALKKLPQEKLEKPIDITTWKETLKAVIHDTTVTTQGSGYAGLEKIAACYVRLMRENFVPVSEDTQRLFRKEFYRCENENGMIKVTYTGTCPLTSGYDQALFNALKERIERIAGKVETGALEQMCR